MAPSASRFVDSGTEQTILVVTGMGKDGTIAGRRGAWERKNLQVVTATEPINGNAAPPRILATHFW